VWSVQHDERDRLCRLARHTTRRVTNCRGHVPIDTRGIGSIFNYFRFGSVRDLKSWRCTTIIQGFALCTSMWFHVDCSRLFVTHSMKIILWHEHTILARDDFLE
ncbi:hypothetical protein LissoIVSPER_00023, partial [Lissonota sp. PSUC_FEM 10030012]|nr:hypothetical protein [Lissonota sp. PSUC_FEM 10030012]